MHTVPLSTIKEVRLGCNTETFKVAAKHAPEENSFSIIYTVGNKFKNLDLSAYSEADKNAWVGALGMLVKNKGTEGGREGWREGGREGGREG